MAVKAVEDVEFVGERLHEYLRKQRGSIAVVDYRRLLGPLARVMRREGALTSRDLQRLLATLVHAFTVVEVDGTTWRLARVERVRKRTRLVYQRQR